MDATIAGICPQREHWVAGGKKRSSIARTVQCPLKKAHGEDQQEHGRKHHRKMLTGGQKFFITLISTMGEDASKTCSPSQSPIDVPMERQKISPGRQTLLCVDSEEIGMRP